MTTTTRSKYFLGAAVASRQALSRIDAYEKLVFSSFGKKHEERQDRHITVMPPFMASYEEASDLNLGGCFAGLLSSHPINTTLFSIRGLAIMEFQGMEFLHFPVEASSSRESWEVYVKRVRENLISAGIFPREAIPDEYRPHITVYGGGNLSKDKEVLRIIEKSRYEPALYFHSVFLNLYTKYKRGWRMLSYDPAEEG